VPRTPGVISGPQRLGKLPVSSQSLPTAERIMKRQRLPLDAALLKEQFEAFHKKLGRDPRRRIRFFSILKVTSQAQCLIRRWQKPFQR